MTYTRDKQDRFNALANSIWSLAAAFVLGFAACMAVDVIVGVR